MALLMNLWVLINGIVLKLMKDCGAQIKTGVNLLVIKNNARHFRTLRNFAPCRFGASLQLEGSGTRHFFCTAKKSTQKKAARRLADLALLGFGSTLARQHIPVLTGEERHPCRSPLGVQPTPAMLRLASRDGKTQITKKFFSLRSQRCLRLYNFATTDFRDESCLLVPKRSGCMFLG